MRTAIGITAALLIALTGCSSEKNPDDYINGMDRSQAAILCQKYLVQNNPGLSLGDFSAVPADGLRKINVGGTEHWQVSDDLDGRAYTCRVMPTGEKSADVEGTFSM